MLSLLSHLSRAINDDNVSEVKEWVESNPNNLNSKDRDSFTALHYAAVSGAEKIVNYLLGAGAIVHPSKKHGSCTMCAMLEINRSLPSRPEEEEKYLRIATVLIEHGIQIGYSPKYDASPLYFAAGIGSTKFVDLLVRHGANVDAKANYVTMTPFLTAVMNGKRETAEQLKDLGADIHTRRFTGENAVHLAIETPELVQLLINWGVNPDLPNDAKRRPLLVACENRYEETVRILLNSGVDTSCKVTVSTGNSRFESMTALELCRFKGYDALAKTIEDYDNFPEIKEPEEDEIN